MLTVRIVDSQEREAWNSYIEHSQYAIAWQVFEWSDVISRHFVYKYIPLAAYDGDKIVGILPLYRGSSGSREGLVSVPFAVAGGIVADNSEAQKALLDKAVELSREYGDLPITLKQYKIRVAGDLKTDENYFNRELSLTSDSSALERQIDPGNLEKAHTAFRSGIEVDYPSKDISAFYKLLLRHNRAQGVPCSSEAWIRTLIDFGMYTIALAKKGSNVLAGTMIKKFKDTVSFPFSCIVPGNNEAQTAVYGLYWNLILRFADEGIHIFHSGRIPRTQETVDFRLGWGGTEYPYFYQYFPNTGGTTEYQNRRGLKRRMVSMVWKHLPLAVIRRISPPIIRRFP